MFGVRRGPKPLKLFYRLHHQRELMIDAECLKICIAFTLQVCEGWIDFIWKSQDEFCASCGTWPEDGSTQLRFALLWYLFCPLVESAVPSSDESNRFAVALLATRRRLPSWLGACFSSLLATFKHAEPVNCGFFLDPLTDQQLNKKITYDTSWQWILNTS